MTSDLYAKGEALRREVLGDAHVEASLAKVDDFNAAIQEFVTEIGWGAVWSRDGLDRRARSMINLAMLTALNRPHEFKVHVRGAVRNGVTPEEIREVLLQSAVYCGAPAALDSFRLAREVLVEMGVLPAAGP